jgi:hypothetical protein
MKPISVGNILKSLGEIDSLNDDKVRKLFERFLQEQPDLVFYLKGVDELGFNQTERKNLIFEGLTIWYIMSLGKAGLPRITTEIIKCAHEANVNWIDRSEGKKQSILDKEVNKMFQDHPQHEVLLYIHEFLNYPRNDIREENKGPMFFTLKTVVDALNGRGVSTKNIYQIKVTLKGSRPPIWRRFQVPGHFTFYDLHRVLQVLMGWEDEHLHEFEIHNLRLSSPNPWSDESPEETEDDDRYKLNEIIVEEKTRFRYIYDFGDWWVHDLYVEKIIPAEHKMIHPICLSGKRACPPEDSGGVWRYEEYLQVPQMSPPENPEDEDLEIADMREWIGRDFNPEHFDLEAINSELAKIK